MGQPTHPNGARVNSIQVADNSVAWMGKEGGFFFQPYLLAILFKFIKHWLTASLVIPHCTLWVEDTFNKRLLVRTKQVALQPLDSFPDLEWENNLPRSLSNSNEPQSITNNVVTRYYRQVPAELVLRDNAENLIRPTLNLRRTRYTHCVWGRPKLLRCTTLIFCVLRGVSAGEPTSDFSSAMSWGPYIQEDGYWKEATEKFDYTYWQQEL